MTDKYSRNHELLSLAKTGDKEALALLVENNIGLVRSIAHRFRERGVEFDDLVQIGSIGMIKAVKSFDSTFGTALSTYAVPMIIGEIKRFLRDDSMIKVSRDIKKRGAFLMRAKEEFKAAHNREPQTSEISAITGLTCEEIIFALDAITPVHSLSENIGSDIGGENYTLENIICGEDDIEEAVNDIALREALDKLTPLRRNLIILRYFKNLSQDQTAKILGITQVKVSREEKKIFAELRGLL